VVFAAAVLAAAAAAAAAATSAWIFLARQLKLELRHELGVLCVF
jgi:hypothetical protein